MVSVRMRVGLVANGAAAVGVALTLLVLALSAPVSPGTGSTQLPGSSSVQTSAGLELHLSVNSTTLSGGQALEVTAWVYNPSQSPVSASVSGNWAVNGLAVGPCGTLNFPMGFAIMRGNLSLSEVRGSPALQLYEPGMVACPMILANIQGYDFAASSSTASITGSCNPSSCFSENMTASGDFSGWYGVLGFQSFSPGTYTAVAGDVWGAVAILHFVVS